MHTKWPGRVEALPRCIVAARRRRFLCGPWGLDLEPGRKAHRLFVAPPGKRVQLATLHALELDRRQGKLSIEFDEPFDLLAEIVATAERVETAEGTASATNEIWLPFVDVYRTKCAIPSPSFRLRLEHVTRLGLAA